MKQIPKYLLIVLMIVSIGSCKRSNKKEVKNEILTLADASVVWWMAPSMIAQKDSIYQKNNLDVKAFDVQTGLASMNAVISGSADIGLVATTPLAMAAFRKENLIILGSYIESSNLLSLITPISTDTITFLKPIEPIALVKGTISELYYYNYMKKYYPNENLENLNQLNVKPPDVPNTMKTKSANSAVIWEPFATMIASANPDLKINRADDIYTMRIYIVTKPKILKTKKEAIDRFVKSIENACEQLKVNESTKKIVLKAFPSQELSMNILWDRVDFSMKYDFDNMKSLLLKEAQTLYELGYTPKDEQGNLRRLKASDIEHYFSQNYKSN